MHKVNSVGENKLLTFEKNILNILKHDMKEICALLDM